MNTATLRRTVLALNTAGLAAYLVWLALRQQRVLYAQEGVLYLLPCIPFFFVYLYLLQRRKDQKTDG